VYSGGDGGGGGGGDNCVQDGENCSNNSLSCCSDYYQCGNDGNCDPPPDPILIDTTGNGYFMTSAADGVLFPVSASATPTRISWTTAGSGDAWLALDLNHNGRIDNVTELFSNFMPIPGSSKHAADGFEVLAAYDLRQNGGNGDGMISASDAIYSQLLLWIDRNHNGVSESDEIFTMSQLGIASIDIHYHKAKFVDQYGNVFRYRSAMTDLTGFHTGRYAYDVILQDVLGRPAHAVAPPPDSSTSRFGKVGITPRDLTAGNPPSKGPADAKVTVAVFSDFQCPFCAKAVQSIAKLQTTYGDDLRVVYRYYPLPFHKWAQPAAKAAACADEQSTAAFWTLHDLYFAHQSELSAKNVIEQSLATLGALPGFDSAAFRRCVAAPAVNAAIARDVQLGHAARVGGTPTIFVNGERAEGTAGMTGAIERILGAQPRASATASDPASGAACASGPASAIGNW
jgi:protein-disulfide isomerase